MSHTSDANAMMTHNPGGPELRISLSLLVKSVYEISVFLGWGPEVGGSWPKP